MIIIAFPFTILIAGMLFSFLDWVRYSISECLSWQANRMYRGLGFILDAISDFFESDIMLLFNISVTVCFWFILVGALMVLTGEYNG
jgi:hypothetical protein